MASSIQPLVLARVVGDVIDFFVPSVAMSVYYGNKRVANGFNLKPSWAVDPPTVRIAGWPTELYTLVMTDPDAPSPSEPTLREWVHWIVADIPGGSDASQGREVLQYLGPRPPIGIHRHVFVLFQQAGGRLQVQPLLGRANFRVRQFSDLHGLGLPVAAVYFNAMKEPSYRGRRHP